MKKITLLLLCLTGMSAAAQFPSPYCDITEVEGVEEITSITFGGATIANSNTTAILADYLATIANVDPGSTYPIVVKGNSYGDYDNDYVAYIDWNRNNILDDAGEIFYIGKITNSTGADAASATVNIAIPSGVTPGTTRIRVVKVYTDEADDYALDQNPCAISVEDTLFGGVGTSYGQAIDFTVNVNSLSTDKFAATPLSIYPNPANNFVNVKAYHDIQEVTIYNLMGQTVLSQKVSGSEFQLNVNNLPVGNYVIKCNGENIQHTTKFTKN